MDKKKTTYADAGVNIAAAEQALSSVKAAIEATHTDAVVSGLADFGGMMALGADYQDPILVSGADGVGTKLKIAFALDKHDTVGQDLVAMNVDDIVCMGAKPLFFLDYLGIGKLEPHVAATVIAGVATACQQAGCVLLGGETAELPGLYAEGEYDLAGFAVGVVERSRIIDGSAIEPGDVIVGLASSGLHSNGYSLARKALLEMAGYRLEQHVTELGCTLGEELLRPTRLYCQDLVPLLAEGAQPHALVHITGGGWYDNIARVIEASKWKGEQKIMSFTSPDGLTTLLDASAVPVAPVFRMIQEAANVETQEMYRTFNMGMGMALVLAADDAEDWIESLNAAGHQAFVVGEVVSGDQPVRINC